MIESLRENNLRLAAERRGFILEKRRGKPCLEFGDGYMIRSAYNGLPVAGYRYEYSAENVRDFLNELKD